MVCAWDMAGGPGWVDGRLTAPFRTLSGLRGKVTDVDFALLEVDGGGGGGVPSVAGGASGGPQGQAGPAGPLLATAGDDGRVRGWHADSGEEAFSLCGQETGFELNAGLAVLGSIRSMSGTCGRPGQCRSDYRKCTRTVANSMQFHCTPHCHQRSSR